MLIKHQGKTPTIHESAYIAPNATIAGDVTIGQDTCVLFGAVITAEGGPVTIGSNCVIMENAVLRGTQRHPLSIADNVLIGPHAHLTGCEVQDNVFIATGVSVFNGAILEAGSVARINCIVHIKSVLPADTFMPIGWIAAGNPAQLYPPDAAEPVLKVLRELNFPQTVFGLERVPNESIMPRMMQRYTRGLKRHRDDEKI